MGNPFPLKQNENKSFQGSIVLGKGFVLTPNEAERLIGNDPRNKDVLFPYLNGDDLNNDPEQRPSRWVINFFDWGEEKAKTYPDCYEIVERLVKPERQRWKLDDKGNEMIGTYALRKPLPQKWWIYGEKRPGLYNTISKLDQVMVVAQVSKTLAFSFVPKSQVISMMCVVFAFDDYLSFVLLQNTLHKEWVQKYASALKADTRYTPSDVFETYPFPYHQLSDISKTRLTHLGKEYYNARQLIMQKMHIGLTKLYNQFHNNSLRYIEVQDEQIDNKIFEKKYGRDALWLRTHMQKNVTGFKYNEGVNLISELRMLHIKMDTAVLEAYGWSDIHLQHDFYALEYLPENDRIRFTVHPSAREKILNRLLDLNHKLHNDEIETSFKAKDISTKTSEINLFTDQL